jgi:ribosomal protein S18 acetylase RimI-like enzyme
MAAGPRHLTGLRRVAPGDVDALATLFAGLPERDRSFLEGRLDREAIAGWAREPGASRWLVAGDDGEARAYLAIIPHGGWSGHVGDLRLVVGAAHRRRGLGRALARHGLLEGIAMSLRKIMVAVAADKEGDLAMFSSIGFRPEALLEDQICDSHGTLHDMVLLSHNVDRVRQDLAAVGIDTAVGLGERG